MSNLNMQLFSLYVVDVVFMPARCFVFRIRSFPENPDVFSKTVVTVLFCFRKMRALIFFVIQKVCLGNFRMTMLPMMS